MEKQIKTFKLMPDYQCFCLWETNNNNISDNIDPNELPISQELKHDLSAWEEKYDATLDWDDPISSGFKSEQEEEQFIKDGENLQKRLQQELGSGFKVTLFIPKD